MARERTGGFVKKTLKRTVTDKKTGETRIVEETREYVRVRYTGADGKRHAVWRAMENRTDGRDIKKALIKKYDERGESALKNERKTFGDLATYYAATSLIPAEYRDDRKINGRRSLGGVTGSLQILVEAFGARPDEVRENVWAGGRALTEIHYDDINSLRLTLLNTPIKTRRVHRIKGEKTPGIRKRVRLVESIEERPRKISTVNRTLEVLRNMLNKAVRKGWLLVNPFNTGERPLISSADEVKRKRLCSFEEETKLYEQCVDKREHLRAIIMCALDTAMRAGEVFTLKVSDIQNYRAAGRNITIQQLNTKTLQERGAPVSRRLQTQFDLLLKEKLNRPDDLLFGVKSVKNSFGVACRAAGIKGLRFHDLRRTAATRLHRGVPELGIPGMAIGEISRILGHQNIKTTYVYIGTDFDTTNRAATLFDAINEQAERVGARVVG